MIVELFTRIRKMAISKPQRSKIAEVQKQQNVEKTRDLE
jgi:hypothetical protein